MIFCSSAMHCAATLDNKIIKAPNSAFIKGVNLYLIFNAFFTCGNPVKNECHQCKEGYA
jgi:hypothetical protein